MKKRLGLVFASAAALASAAHAQHGGGTQRGGAHDANPPRANGGRIPAAPEPRRGQRVEREVERDQGGHLNEVPRVRNGHWYGHEAPDNKRFHGGHSFEGGRF